MDGDQTPQGARGPDIDVCRIDGGRFRISSSDSPQGVCHRRFLALMVDATGSPAPAPPRGATVNICYIDGGRSRISVSAPMAPAIDAFFNLCGGRCPRVLDK
jgi:hypothetical protein